jgi:hypothetical protein
MSAVVEIFERGASWFWVTSTTRPHAQTCNYGYDDLTRRTGAHGGNSVWNQAFGYDVFGNITTKTRS